MRIMGIYAHPADVATEAAGTMAIHADRGDELTAVVLSDGIRMHPHFLTVGEGAGSSGAGQPRGVRGVQARRGPPGGRDHRHRERPSSWAGTPDFFDATDERIATLARVIVRYRPDVILTHYPVGPYLIDSNAFAGIYATRAMHEATTLIPQVDGVEPHYTKELFFFLMDQSMDTRSNIDTPGIVADFFVDTTPSSRARSRPSTSTSARATRASSRGRSSRRATAGTGCTPRPRTRSRSCSRAAPATTRCRSRQRLLDSTYVANNLPGEQLLARDVPSATPPEAYRIRR